MLLVQGLICFESIMEAAHRRGLARNNVPVLCKPSRKVHWPVQLAFILPRV